MNETEYKEVLEFLRDQVRKSNYRDVDEVISMETRQIDASRVRLEMYLKMLIGMVRERSNSQAFNINKRLGMCLETKSNDKFGGIKVQLSQTEAENFGISSFTLSELDEVSEFIVQLEDILSHIHNDLDPSDPEENMGPRP